MKYYIQIFSHKNIAENNFMILLSLVFFIVNLMSLFLFIFLLHLFYYRVSNFCTSAEEVALAAKTRIDDSKERHESEMTYESSSSWCQELHHSHDLSPTRKKCTLNFFEYI